SETMSHMVRTALEAFHLLPPKAQRLEPRLGGGFSFSFGLTAEVLKLFDDVSRALDSPLAPNAVVICNGEFELLSACGLVKLVHIAFVEAVCVRQTVRHPAFQKAIDQPQCEPRTDKIPAAFPPTPDESIADHVWH